MEELIKQIKIGIDNNLYLLGLYSALTLPDICGAVNTKKGLANGQNFRAWYDEYVFPKYNALTADECYNFRCRVLHQGQTVAKNKTDYYTKIIFAEPQPVGGSKLSLNIGRSTINGQAGPKSIDVIQFIEAILNGAERWILEKKGTEPFATNYAKCLNRHPEGLAPFVAGFPMIY